MSFDVTGSRGHGHGGGGGGYAQIVGKFTGEVTLPGGNPHARMDLDVNGDQYEADINTHSNDGSNVQYEVRDTQVSSLPAPGVHTDARFSYDGAGLDQKDFKPVDSDDFHNNLEGWAHQSAEVALNGMTYSDGAKHGVHDIHMNSGESSRSAFANQNGQDGYATFYIPDGNGTYDKKDVFIKFQTQTLSAAANEQQAREFQLAP